MKQKAIWSSLENQLVELHEKYHRLVWLARKQPKDYKNPEIAKIIDQVNFDYPDEVVELSSPIEGDWHHGFNSGMLACIRYIYSIKNESIEIAEQEFPDLDT